MIHSMLRTFRYLFTLLILQPYLFGCGGGSDAFIPPIRRAVFISPTAALVINRDFQVKQISLESNTRTFDFPNKVAALDFLDPTKGWVVDSEWNSWRLQEGVFNFVGTNNDKKSTPSLSTGLQFVDEKYGWARSITELFATQDGGVTWSHVLTTEPGYLKDMLVLDRKTLFLYGSEGMSGALRLTRDSGLSWESIHLGSSGDITTMLCGGLGKTCLAGTSTGEIFRITQDGASEQLEFPRESKLSITHISQLAENSIIVSGFGMYTSSKDNLGGVLLVTHDNGKSWQFMNVPIDQRFVSVKAFGDVIWLASLSSIYRSSDAGQTWTKVYTESAKK